MAEFKKTEAADAMDALIASAMPYIKNRELEEYETADPSVVPAKKTVPARETREARPLPLFFRELSKFRTRFNLVLLAVLFLANLAVAAVETGSYWQNSGEVRNAVNALLYEYNNDRAAYDASAEDYEERRQALFYGRGEFENRLIDVPGYGDSALFRDVEPITERSRNYGRDIRRVVDSAVRRASDPDVEKGSYVYEYQAQLILHYRPLQDTEIPAEGQFGWNEYFSLRVPAILLALASLAVFSGVWLGEKRSRIVNVLRVSKRGSAPLILAKLSASALVSVCLTLAFTLSPLAVIAVTRGFSPLSMPVQALSAFEFCPYALTVGQFLALTVSVQVALFLLFDLLVVFLGQLLDHELPVYGILLVLLTAGYWLSGRQTDSPLYGLRSFNFIDLAAGDFLFGRYRALNLGGRLVGLIPALIALGFVAFALLAGLPFAVGLRADSYRIFSFRLPVRMKFPKRAEKEIRFRAHSLSVFGYEMSKSMFLPVFLGLTLFALGAKFFVSDAYFKPYEGSYWEVYTGYMAELRGPVTEEKIRTIEDEERYVSQCFADYDLAQAAYRDGDMELEEFREISERRNYADLVQRPLERIRERLDYLTDPAVAEKYDNLEFLDETAVMRLFRQPLDYIFLVLLTILLSDLFIREYRTGFKSILHTAKNGSSKTWGSKWGAAFIGTVIIWFLFAGVDFYEVWKTSDTTIFSAGLLSIPDMRETGLDMTVGQYLVRFELIRLFGSLALCAAVAGLSALTHRLSAQFAAVFAVIFIPSLLSTLGADRFESVSIAELLAPKNVPGSLGALFGWGAMAILLVAVSAWTWGKSKVRFR